MCFTATILVWHALPVSLSLVLQTFTVIRIWSAWNSAIKVSHVWSMQNFTVDQCGPVHITMGDGGNIEGVCKCPALLHLDLRLPGSAPPSLPTSTPQALTLLHSSSERSTHTLITHVQLSCSCWGQVVSWLCSFLTLDC